MRFGAANKKMAEREIPRGGGGGGGGPPPIFLVCGQRLGTPHTGEKCQVFGLLLLGFKQFEGLAHFDAPWGRQAALDFKLGCRSPRLARRWMGLSLGMPAFQVRQKISAWLAGAVAVQEKRAAATKFDGLRGAALWSVVRVWRRGV